MSRVLVTGAAGFLGRNVARSMVERGHEVLAMVQHEIDAQAIGTDRVAIAVADLLDDGSLCAAVAGAEIVCHCAAKLPGKASPDAIWAANAEGSTRLVAACVQAGVRRLVYVSTDSVYGDALDSTATESSPLDPTYFYEGNYPRSKLEGERAAVRAAREHGLEVAIIRPCLMYGPDDSPGTNQIRRWAATRIHPLIDGGSAQISMAFVTDAALAIALAAEHPAAAGRVYNVSSGESHSKRAILEAIAATTGRPKYFVPLPGRPLDRLLRALRSAVAPFSSTAAAALDPARVRFSMTNHCVDIGRIRGELGFEPRVSLRAGLRRTLCGTS